MIRPGALVLGALTACGPSEDVSDVHGRNPNLPILDDDTGIPLGEVLVADPNVDLESPDPLGPLDYENLRDTAEELRDTDGDVTSDAFDDGLPGTDATLRYSHGGDLRPIDSNVDGIVRMGLRAGVLSVDLATRGQMPGSAHPVWLHAFEPGSNVDAVCPDAADAVAAPAFWPLLPIRTDHNGWVDREYEMVTGGAQFPDLAHAIVVVYDPDGAALACAELEVIPPRPGDTIENATGDPGEELR